MEQLKFNPFRPGSIVSPVMFSGRANELSAIEKCLFQTKHGNPRHFLIEGERGIGKSSLLLFVKMLAAGNITWSETRLHFIVLDIELNGNSTDLDIVSKLGSSMHSALNSNLEVGHLAKTIIEFITNWKILGVEYKKSSSILDPIQIVDDLAKAVRDLVLCSGHILDGVVVLIDEADKPEALQAKLGEMLKLFTERLTRIGCERVCIGLAGLPTLIPKLRASHESAPRIFETLSLGALSLEDRKNVIMSGLKEANLKNKQQTSISPDGLDALAVLSEGYPHFLQEFAYSAFAQDRDDIIDDSDVTEGVFKKGGAIYQLGKRYFESLYYEKISSPDYRRVLQGMAERLDAWSTRQQIIELSGIKDSQVNNALNALRARGIILYNEQRRGEYRLPTKSFAVWLKILGERADEVLDSEQK